MTPSLCGWEALLNARGPQPHYNHLGPLTYGATRPGIIAVSLLCLCCCRHSSRKGARQCPYFILMLQWILSKLEWDAKFWKNEQLTYRLSYLEKPRWMKSHTWQQPHKWFLHIGDQSLNGFPLFGRSIKEFSHWKLCKGRSTSLKRFV